MELITAVWGSLFMKNVILLSTLLGFGLLLGTGHAQADSYVNSYTKKDGTFVKGYMKSDPDGIFSNNYSSYGNVNPYTGKKGTKKSASDSNYYAPNYSAGIPSYSPTPKIAPGCEEYLDSSAFGNNPSIPVCKEPEKVDSTDIVENAKEFNKNLSSGLATTNFNDKVASPKSSKLNNLNEDEAIEVVYSYFDSLNDENYKAAYKMWSSHWKKNHSYAKFKTGYKDVYHNVYNVYVISSQSNKITLAVSETTFEPDGARSYEFVYSVKTNGNNKGKMLSGKLQKKY